MRSRLCGVLAALALLAAPALVRAEDDAMSGRINHGSAEIGKPPNAAGGSMPDAIDDPARNVANDTSSATNSGAATEGPQNPRLGAAPPDAPPGASPQTMPSTLSAQNAAEDRLSWMARMLPLTDEQKQALRTGILREQEAAPAAPADARVAQAKIGNILPSSVAMSDLPGDVTQRVPQARGFKYVRAGDRLLIVQPESWTVVGIL